MRSCIRKCSRGRPQCSPMTWWRSQADIGWGPPKNGSAVDVFWMTWWYQIFTFKFYLTYLRLRMYLISLREIQLIKIYGINGTIFWSGWYDFAFLFKYLPKQLVNCKGCHSEFLPVRNYVKAAQSRALFEISRSKWCRKYKCWQELHTFIMQ